MQSQLFTSLNSMVKIYLIIGTSIKSTFIDKSLAFRGGKVESKTVKKMLQM